jgi:hypothetical protein
MTTEVVKYIDTYGGTTTLGRFVDMPNAHIWNVEPVFDEVPGDDALFSGYDLQRRTLALVVAVAGTAHDAVIGTIASWRSTFMKDASRYRTVQALGTVVVEHNGGTYSSPAANAAPDISGPYVGYAGLTLRWQAPSPLWKFNATQSTLSAFNGTVAVNVVWNNTGDYRTWPVHRLVGIVNTPKIRDYPNADYIQIGTAMAGSADEMWIWTNPPLVRYYAGGTAAGDKLQGDNWTGYAGTVSTFYALQDGAGTARLSSLSGSAAYTLYYDIRKAGIS